MSSLRPRTPTRARGQRGRTAFPGPLLLLFPLLAFAIAIARLQNARPQPGGYPAAPSQGRAIAAEAWVDRAGGEVRATLTRLHADAERQRFDTRALQRRLGFGAGEPWRLELRYDPRDPGAAPLDLEALAVRDAAGLKLLAPEAPAPPPPDGVADPVAVWVSPPTALAPGRTTSVLLWGDEPRPDAVVVGAGAELRLSRGFHEVPERGSLLARLEEPADLPTMEQTAEGGDR